MKQLVIIPAIILTIACANESKQSTTIPEPEPIVAQDSFVPIREKNNPRIMVQPMVSFKDSLGVFVQVFHFISEPEKIRVTIPDGSDIFLNQAMAASGVRYTNEQGFEFWEHHGEATLSINDSTFFVGKLQ